jgi:hypothetical protein
MSAYVQKLLAKHANTATIDLHPVFVPVLRAARDLGLAALAHATAINNQIIDRLRMLRRLFTYANLATAGLWAALALHDVPARAPRATTRAIEPMRLTLQDHWRRATGVIVASLAAFERVKAFQAAAERQIDAADYALSQLLHDLRPAMALPADVSGLRAVLAEAERTAPVRQRKAALAA